MDTAGSILEKVAQRLDKYFKTTLIEVTDNKEII